MANIVKIKKNGETIHPVTNAAAVIYDNVKKETVQDVIAQTLSLLSDGFDMSKTAFGRTDELSVLAGKISLNSEAPRFQHQNEVNIRPDEISVSNVDTSDGTTTSTVFVTPDTVKFYERQEQDGLADVTKEQSLTIDDVEKLHALPTAIALNSTLNSKANSSDISYIKQEVQLRPHVSNIYVDTSDNYIDIVVPYAVGWGEDKDEENKLVTIEAATSTDAGLMSKEDKQKIDELPNNADLEVQIDNKTINWFTVNNDNGVKVTVGLNDMDSSSRLSILIPNASNTKAGVMSASDKGKLDGITSKISVDEYDNITLSGDNLIILNSGTDITLFAGGGNDVKIESDGGDIVLKINSTTLTLDESKLQRLAQLLA